MPEEHELPRGTTIDQRGGSWTVRRRLGSARIRRSFPTYERAHAFALLLCRAKTRGEVIMLVHATDTLDQWFERWLRSYAPSNLAPNTAEVYVQVYTRHVEPLLGQVRLQDLDNRLQAWANGLDAVGIPTARKARSVLSSVLRYAVREEALRRNPLRDVEFVTPRAEKPSFAPAATPEFVERMLRLTHGGDALIIACMAYAGMRPEEAVAIVPAAIKHSGTVLWVAQTISWGTVSAIKNCKPRSVPLLPPLRDLLETHIAEAAPTSVDDLLITRADGLPWSVDDYRNFRSRFKRARRWAGDVRQRPKDMRATYATMLLESGTSLREVARHLGDREDTVAKHYYRYRDDADRVLEPTVQIMRARERVAADPPARPTGGRPRRAAGG